jgi:hypothetical protein
MLDHSSVTNNTSSYGGGGHSNWFSVQTVTLNDSTVTNNVPDNCYPLGGVAGCTG